MIINTGTRCDIPAFFHKWFLNRIDDGFVCTKNPYNGEIYKFSLNSKIIDCLCFCTKNPKPLINNFESLEKYNQFWFVTINPYEKDIEVNVPHHNKVINYFIELSQMLGVNRVSWRYDPIFITEKYSLDFHIDKFEEIASQISGYTDDCTISFIDMYKKVKKNFPEAREVKDDERMVIGDEFSKIAKKYDIQMKTCVEGTLFDQFGFDSSGCMTKQVLEKAIGFNLKIPKGKYRVRYCNCLLGRDIGAYNTCMHGCKYCYANNQEVIYYFSLTTDNSIILSSN